MNRQELIDRLQWNNGGTGYGICSVGNALLWAAQQPKEPRGADDLKSVVAISEPADRYTDEELTALVAFSDEMTADYDRLFAWRLGANMICIAKTSDRQWMRKRMSWEYGPMASPTLQEALDVFRDKPALASVDS